MKKRFVGAFDTRYIKKSIEDQINEYLEDNSNITLIQISYSVGVYPSCNSFESALAIFEVEEED